MLLIGVLSWNWCLEPNEMPIPSFQELKCLQISANVEVEQEISICRTIDAQCLFLAQEYKPIQLNKHISNAYASKGTATSSTAYV